MQLVGSKKSTQLPLDKPRQSYQSLDKVDKKHLASSNFFNTQNYIHLFLIRKASDFSKRLNKKEILIWSKEIMKNGLLLTNGDTSKIINYQN